MKKNKNLYIPTETEKIHMIEHVRYENDMFKYCYEKLTILKVEGFFYNVFIEAFLLHARNLYTFFYIEKNNRNEDDILAEDYSINLKNFYSKRPNIDEFKDFKTNWNKKLNHITYSRLDYIDGKKTWDWQKLFNLIDKTVKAFFDSLPPEQIQLFI